MPWLAQPYGDTRKQQLLKQFDIKGIPALVILDSETGIPISTRARKDISSEADIPAVIASWDKQFGIVKKRMIYNAEQAHRRALLDQ